MKYLLNAMCQRLPRRPATVNGKEGVTSSSLVPGFSEIAAKRSSSAADSHGDLAHHDPAYLPLVADSIAIALDRSRVPEAISVIVGPKIC